VAEGTTHQHGNSLRVRWATTSHGSGGENWYSPDLKMTIRPGASILVSAMMVFKLQHKPCRSRRGDVRMPVGVITVNDARKARRSKRIKIIQRSCTRKDRQESEVGRSVETRAFSEARPYERSSVDARNILLLAVAVLTGRRPS